MARKSPGEGQGSEAARPRAADVEQLTTEILELLRELPLARRWLDGDAALELRYRAFGLAAEAMRRHGCDDQDSPRHAARAMDARFAAFIRSWEVLPIGGRPEIDWDLFERTRRGATAAAIWRAQTPSKEKFADLCAETFNELTGRPPTARGGDANTTPFERLVCDACDRAGLGCGRFAAKHAAMRWTRNRHQDSESRGTDER